MVIGTQIVKLISTIYKLFQNPMWKAIKSFKSPQLISVRSFSRSIIVQNKLNMPEFDDSFLMNHTCLRIKDPKVTVPFYTENFGLQLLRTVPFPDFTLYMLGYENAENKSKNWSAREGVLELCHNHGVENDPDFKLNHVLEEKLLAKDVKFQKKLSDGRQKDIAFALDPNGYWIELIEHANGKVEAKTDASTYKFNHSMIRVKDPKASLDFYRNVLGFKLISSHEFPAAKFTLYFLGYDHSPDFKEDSADRTVKASREGLIELTHNWGTEGGAIQGYGHTAVSCKDPDALCKQIEEEYGDKVKWSLKWDQGKIKRIAFIQDPDGYSIEIVGYDLLTKDSNL
ncbi:glyoxalase I [Scheffersomyces coipomensis]|uniref:glyoxalase I n=1 Tax=Scheffersomyces coipomensis TaxID=1788519 RepID=UPI00315DCFBA